MKKTTREAPEILIDNSNISYNEELVKEYFDRFYNKKKKYVDSYDYLKKEFDKYEIVELESYEIEYDKYKKRIKEFVNRYKEKLNIKTESEIKKLYLLALGITTPAIMDLFMKNHLNICNTTNKFLTSYEECIQSRHNSKSFTKAGEIINSTCFNEAIIKNYKEDNNNICFEIEIEGKDNKIYTYKIELINIQKIYTRDFVCLPPSYISAEEMIKENYRIPYKEVSSIKERIESDNILNTIFIASYEDIPICVYIQMDWSVHEHKILCQDIKTSIHNSQKL